MPSISPSVPSGMALRFTPLLLSSIILLVGGCSGSGSAPSTSTSGSTTTGTGTGTGTGTTTSSTVTLLPTNPLPSLTTRSVSGKVTLPAGSKVDLASLTVLNSVGSTRVDAGGNYTLTSYDNGLQVAIVLSPTGSPMLLGWADGTHTALDADSTARVLAYEGLGGWLMLSEADRESLDKLLPSLATLPALSKVVATEVAANPDAFTTLNANLKAALTAFVSDTVGVKAKGAVRPLGILVQPGEQSGSNVIQVAPASGYFTTHYRRRTHVFVDRVSHTGSDGVVVSDKAAVTNFAQPPVGGLNGGLAGAVTDLFNYYYGNSAAAYADVNSDTFGVPNVSGADKTSYEVLQVGPGGGNGATGATPEQVSRQQRVSIEGLALDFLVPFVSNAIVGSGFVPAAQIGGASASPAQKFATNVANDMLGLLPSLPGTAQKAYDGDIRGAMTDLLNTFYTTASLRVKFVNDIKAALLEAGFKPGDSDYPALGDAMDKFDTVINAAGGALQVFDTAVYSTQVIGSNKFNRWTVDTTAQKVTLTPATSTINQGDTTALAAFAPGADSTGFSYRWSLIGSYGTLSETNGASRTGQTDFCSSSAQVSYVSDSSKTIIATATDTVLVKVYARGSCKDADLLGAATATVSTNTTPSLLNGDFSQGLANWTMFGNVRSIKASTGGCANRGSNPYAAMDTYYVQEGLQQTFRVPGAARTVSMVVWGNLDPATAVISMVSDKGVETTLGRFTAPSTSKLADPRNDYSAVCNGVSPTVVTYDISAYAGKIATLKLGAAWLQGYNGTFVNYDDVVVK